MSVMSWLVFIALCVGAVSAVPSPILAPLNPLEHTEHTIPEEYIVVFKQDACKMQVQEHMKSLNDTLEAFDGVYYVRYTYDMGSGFRGYSAHMDEMTLERVRGMSEVKYVERNQRIASRDHELEEQMRLDRVHHMGELDVESNQRAHSNNKVCKEQLCADLIKGNLIVNWGLVRISHTGPVGKRVKYVYDEAMQGEGVDIYILGSGIDVDNPEFEGRAKWGEMLVPKVKPIDVVGDGTAMAGVAISRKYGVAKEARAIAMGVSDEVGKVKLDAVLAALGVIQKKHKPKRSVVLITFNTGTPLSNPDKEKAIDDAAKALFTTGSGVPVVVSAGDTLPQGKDACSKHPASENSAITVAASNVADVIAPFSNYGECVNIIAPGVDIITLALQHDKWTRKTGTAFAASYVAGVLARIMTNGDLTSLDAKKRLYELAEMGAIKMPVEVKVTTKNVMLNYLCSEKTLVSH